MAIRKLVWILLILMTLNACHRAVKSCIECNEPLHPAKIEDSAVTKPIGTSQDAASVGSANADRINIKTVDVDSSKYDSSFRPPLGDIYIPKEKLKTLPKVYGTVSVFFATDREKSSSRNPKLLFTGNRSQKDSYMTYGITEVTIPIAPHHVGRVENPSILKFEFKENRAKHFTILKINLDKKEKFFKKLEAHVAASDRKNAFLFIHGYNVKFEDAAKRTAQIAYDLEFDGPATFYSWPSEGKYLSYGIDSQNIQWSEDHIKNFLIDFIKRTNAERVYLIAHSMGNYGLVRALSSLATERPALLANVKEVILTAPDIDSGAFKNQIKPVLNAKNQSVTLYASSADKALMAARLAYKNPRAGYSGKDIVLLKGLVTIDATNIETDFLSHSYFSDSPTVLSDISYLIKKELKPTERSYLKRKDSIKGSYWEFAKLTD